MRFTMFRHVNMKFRRIHPQVNQTKWSCRGPVKNPLTNTTVFQLVAQIQDPASKWKIQPNFPGPLLSFLLNVLNVPNPIPVYTSPNFWVVATGTAPGKPGAVPLRPFPGLLSTILLPFTFSPALYRSIEPFLLARPLHPCTRTLSWCPALSHRRVSAVSHPRSPATFPLLQSPWHPSTFAPWHPTNPAP